MENEEWDIFWADTSVNIERLMKLKPFQKLNHFPGMQCLARKVPLARTMINAQAHNKTAYSFFPRSWVLPDQYSELKQFMSLRRKKKKTIIMKPSAGCQGNGIILTQSIDDIPKECEPTVAQVYLEKPFLLDGYKFDMRIYVLVTSVAPLRIYVYKEGMARLCTTPYVAPTEENCDDLFMHLTNFAINKKADNFTVDDDETGDSGFKRTLSSVFRHMEDRGYDVDAVWRRIQGLVVKTLIAGQSVLAETYLRHQPAASAMKLDDHCFELLGFDIILTRGLKPVLLEVNHSPSLATEAQLDLQLKSAVVGDTMDLIFVTADAKQRALNAIRSDARARLEKNSDTLSKPTLGTSSFSQYQQRQMTMEAKKLAGINHSAVEEYVAWHNASRIAHEESHLGGFERIYPPCVEEKEDPISSSANSEAEDWKEVQSAENENENENARENGRAPPVEVEDYESLFPTTAPSGVSVMIAGKKSTALTASRKQYNATKHLASAEALDRQIRVQEIHRKKTEKLLADRECRRKTEMTEEEENDMKREVMEVNADPHLPGEGSTEGDNVIPSSQQEETIYIQRNGNVDEPSRLITYSMATFHPHTLRRKPPTPRGVQSGNNHKSPYELPARPSSKSNSAGKRSSAGNGLYQGMNVGNGNRRGNDFSDVPGLHISSMGITGRSCVDRR